MEAFACEAEVIEDAAGTDGDAERFHHRPDGQLKRR
jgi:hypothetical protein